MTDQASRGKISREEVVHIASLARLGLDDGELDAFTRELGAILDHASTVAEIDLRDVSPMSHPIALSNVLRDDVLDECLELEDLQSNAPDFFEGKFRVPKILDEP